MGRISLRITGENHGAREVLIDGTPVQSGNDLDGYIRLANCWTNGHSHHAPCNQAAHALVANADFISQIYLFFVLFSLREHINSLAQGAAQQNISKEKVASAMAVVPPRDILASFDSIADPIFSQLRTLQRQIQNLRRTRDLLLPRLLSGQLDVEVLPEPALQEVS